MAPKPSVRLVVDATEEQAVPDGPSAVGAIVFTGRRARSCAKYFPRNIA